MKKPNNRMIAFVRDLYSCRYPDCKVSGIGNIQAAHRISDTIANRSMIKSYLEGKHNIMMSTKEVGMIIGHYMNLRTSCSTHNDYFNIAGNQVYTEKLIDMIYCEIFESE